MTLVTAAWPQSGNIYEQAAAYIQKDQPSSAIRLLEPRIREVPGDLKALTLMGMAFSAENRRQEGNRYFQQALKSNPSFVPALRGLALNEMAQSNPRSARVHFGRLLELTPADPAVRLALAQTFIELKEPDKAFEVLDRMPREAEAAAHFSAGTLLAGIERFTAAAREFELAQSGYPNVYDAGFNLMLAYVKSGQYAAAARTGENLVGQGHKQAELYNLLAQAYEASGKTAEAYEALRTATQIDAGDPANYLDLIALCLTHRNYDLALEIADIGVSRLPKSDRIHLQRGIVLAMKDNFEGARAEFESTVKLSPETSLPYVALSLMLLQTDNTGEAVAVLRRRAQKGGDYLSLWFLGEALDRMGAAAGSPDENEAVAALSRSVEMKPDVAPPRILLAKLLARRGQLEIAEKHLTQALLLDPDNTGAIYQLAQICQRRGESARARELFAKVSRAKQEDREQFTRGGLQHIIRAESR